ncbi:N-acetylmuramoyl-L-alanine amidase [Clostridium sp. D2Q-11]|uniref:N-acetylmuramoyl-L-alanine amidase n=1 Tax=Anaeromonas frigoriresistens TaxID=2683708 RepID=A0A942Z890_9FIRM|nr:N-acetylmuramoyl-L-alanine amidase [Anaeromonas frigoriresistens]MBS4539542.1 N-acetylmuramoyl-L-alanine amidase [Anaeromonas frigoriresistens]
MKIIIDPGHGGKDTEGGSNSHWLEKDMNLKISLYQYNIFKELGVEVEITRNDDTYLSPDKRTSIVKESGAEICISNHINNFTNSSPKGDEIIHSIYSDGKLAQLIMEELVGEGVNQRKVFTKRHPKDPTKDYYYMNRETGNVETVIIEYGFASNPEDKKKILNNWGKYAAAVVRGLLEYLDITYKSNLRSNSILDEMLDYKKSYENLLNQNILLRESNNKLSKKINQIRNIARID